jgi:hypothetical protein
MAHALCQRPLIAGVPPCDRFGLLTDHVGLLRPTLDTQRQRLIRQRFRDAPVGWPFSLREELGRFGGQRGRRRRVFFPLQGTLRNVTKQRGPGWSNWSERTSRFAGIHGIGFTLCCAGEKGERFEHFSIIYVKVRQH